MKLYAPEKPELINLKDIVLYKKEVKQKSRTFDRTHWENKIATPFAICGKPSKEGFIPKHFIVIQMEMTEEQKYIQKMKRGTKAKERKLILENMIIK